MMQKFFRGEAHVDAMKTLKDVSSYAKVHGYFADVVPPADDAIYEWWSDGRRIFGEPMEAYGDCIPERCTSPLQQYVVPI